MRGGREERIQNLIDEVVAVVDICPLPINSRVLRRRLQCNHVSIFSPIRILGVCPIRQSIRHFRDFGVVRRRHIFRCWREVSINQFVRRRVVRSV